MQRWFLSIIIATIIPISACSRHAEAPLELNTEIEFSCLLFNGPSANRKFNGQISSDAFTKWFQQDYDVGGERIETPHTANSIGVLILRGDNKMIVMPLCTWTIDTGHKYFACQSDSIGTAPMFSVCTESKTIDQFLEQMKNKLSNLSDDDG